MVHNDGTTGKYLIRSTFVNKVHLSLGLETNMGITKMDSHNVHYGHSVPTFDLLKSNTDTSYCVVFLDKKNTATIVFTCYFIRTIIIPFP